MVPRVIVSLPLAERIQRKGLYLSADMGAPPAERKDNVVQFEITTGCSYNGCNFCTMYKSQEHHKKGLEDFKGHVDNVWNAIRKKDPGSLQKLKRIFIGGGDALSVDTDILNKAVLYAVRSFRDNVGTLPSRVAIYGNTQDILAKGGRNLKLLNCGGTCGGGCSINLFGSKRALGVVYWGLESGSPEVLKFLNKRPYEKKDLEGAVSAMDSSGIRSSVMIMPGAGGVALSDKHIEGTREILHRLRPEFLTFIGMKVYRGTAYAKKISAAKAAGKNRNMTAREIAEQTADMIDGIDFTTTVGCHSSSVHRYGDNPPIVQFGSRTLYGGKDARQLAQEMREWIMVDNL